MSQSMSPSTCLRVLLVDDSSLMRRIIRTILERDPHLRIIGEAADGNEALQKAAALKPDLILIDIEMPHLDGLGFLRQARLSCATPAIVISSLARPGSDQAITALELGAIDIMAKPSGVLSVDFDAQYGDHLIDAIHQWRRRASLLAPAWAAAGTSPDQVATHE